MKIYVKGGNCRLKLRIPTVVIFSRPAAWLYWRGIKTSFPEPFQGRFDTQNLSKEGIYTLCQEIRRIKKKHGTYPLVEVNSSDGDQVQIVL